METLFLIFLRNLIFKITLRISKFINQCGKLEIIIFKKTKNFTQNEKTTQSRINYERNINFEIFNNKQIIMDSSPNGNPFGKASDYSTNESENGSNFKLSEII